MICNTLYLHHPIKHTYISMIFYWRLLRLGSFSPSRIILERSESRSLVDLPTFISHSVTLCSVVKITEAPEDSPQSEKTPDLDRGGYSRLERQQREASKEKKRQWTIMCVAFGFFTSCLMLVGVMLSITSEYQVILTSAPRININILPGSSHCQNAQHVHKSGERLAIFPIYNGEEKDRTEL